MYFCLDRLFIDVQVENENLISENANGIENKKQINSNAEKNRSGVRGAEMRLNGNGMKRKTQCDEMK